MRHFQIGFCRIVKYETIEDTKNFSLYKGIFCTHGIFEYFFQYKSCMKFMEKAYSSSMIIAESKNWLGQKSFKIALDPNGCDDCNSNKMISGLIEGGVNAPFFKEGISLLLPKGSTILSYTIEKSKEHDQVKPFLIFSLVTPWDDPSKVVDFAVVYGETVMRYEISCYNNPFDESRMKIRSLGKKHFPSQLITEEGLDGIIEHWEEDQSEFGFQSWAETKLEFGNLLLGDSKQSQLEKFMKGSKKL
ncbi:MAG: hypothetical protein ACRCXZ_01490 [Patescibacteria group bacterium]